MVKCTGCEYCRNQRIPNFSSEAEEENFWAVHTADQFAMSPVRVVRRGRPVVPEKRERITMMLMPKLKEELERMAAARGIGYQTLIQEVLAEYVQADIHAKQAHAPA